MSVVALAVPRRLTTRPLTFGIEHERVAGFTLAWGEVDACAERLVAGSVALALLPSTCYAALAEDLRILPGIAVTMLATPQSPLAEEQVLDPLATTIDEWCARTGLPFVSWVWVGRPGAIDRVQAEALGRSLELGRAAGGQEAGLAYRLGGQELSGLAALVEEVRTLGGVRQRGLVRLLDCGDGPPALPRSARPGAVARSTDALLADAASGERLSPEDGLRLYHTAALLDLGRAADLRRQALHPGDVVTYIIDRNVNYTNLCVTACKFCNFYRPVARVAHGGAYAAKSRDGYTLSYAELARKLQETVDLGGVQVLLQGGVNPNLRLSYYEELFRWVKANFPLALHALSPEEVSFIAKLEGLSLAQVLERLVAAGLDSLPGGGAEILDDEIRDLISPLKCRTDTWLAVMREAHALGLRTTSTLVFGFGEEGRHVLAHLERLRALQDVTSGFTAFICWPFQAEGTRLKLHDDTTAHRYLRTFALARLYLDNIPNLQVSWPTMGPALGQIALRFGGNDFGSAMIEENVVSQAGAVFTLSAAGIERCIGAAGFAPRRRNMRYQFLSGAGSSAGLVSSAAGSAG
ncbi:MAG: cyclic dehypoxanthinyl futalosine synthase [Polyangia bacterium]